MKKRDKGISLISLTVAVCILIVLSSMLLYNAKSGVNIRKLKMMQNDIATLDDAIDSYYAKYGALPTKIEYDVMPLPFYDTRNPNDNDVYYVIDLTALEGITLNYGLEYNDINTQEDLLDKEDFYVINEQSHQIYYARGIEMDGVVYYGGDADEVIELNEKKWLKIVAGYNSDIGLDTRGNLYFVDELYTGKMDENKNYINAKKGFEEIFVLSGKKIIEISAGYTHTGALDEQGKVYTWGDNYNGQLGNGTRTNSNIPQCINDIEGIVGISAGNSYTVAIDKEGKVYTWGDNGFGQLGNGTRTDSSIPQCINDIEGIVGISSGDYHTIAIDEEGKVYTWGSNSSGQLGDGTTTNSSVPICISEIEGNILKGKKIVGISAGRYHTSAIDKEGNVYTWGDNYYGQLGNGTRTNSSVPIYISEIEGNILKGKKIVGISSREGHAIAIDEEGKMYTWGSNSSGQLGDGTTTNSSVPICISEIEGNILNGKKIVGISAGWYHTTAIDEEGRVYVWGDNYEGQLGEGTTNGSAMPICISEIEGNILKGKKIVGISAGEYYTIAIDEEGKVYTWGDNDEGQLGNSLNENMPEPVCISTNKENVLKGKRIKDIEAQGHSIVAVDEEGKVYSWGANEYGQLGDGTTIGSAVPICISDILGNVLNGKKIVGIAAGWYHAIAIDEEGKVYTWGDNYEGQLGEGTTNGSAMPICISEIEGNILKGKKIVGISAGEYYTIAIDEEGKVYTWGDNDEGQLGDGTTNGRAMPICISNISENVLNGKKIVGISASWGNTAAIDEEGKVYTWGNNYYGQLGNGITPDSTLPICISEIEGNALKGKKIVGILSGGSYTIAIDEEGYVYVWGKIGDGWEGDLRYVISPEIDEPICLSDIEESGLKNKKVICVEDLTWSIVFIDEQGEVISIGFWWG